MKAELIQLLKDFYSDRDSYDKHGSHFQSAIEIYENHAERIRRTLHPIIAETMRNEVLKVIDAHNLGGQLNHLVEEINKI